MFSPRASTTLVHGQPLHFFEPIHNQVIVRRKRGWGRERHDEMFPVRHDVEHGRSGIQAVAGRSGIEDDTFSCAGVPLRIDSYAPHRRAFEEEQFAAVAGPNWQITAAGRDALAAARISKWSNIN